MASCHFLVHSRSIIIKDVWREGVGKGCSGEGGEVARRDALSQEADPYPQRSSARLAQQQPSTRVATVRPQRARQEDGTVEQAQRVEERGAAAGNPQSEGRAGGITQRETGKSATRQQIAQEIARLETPQSNGAGLGSLFGLRGLFQR